MKKSTTPTEGSPINYTHVNSENFNLETISALVANKRGEIFDLQNYAAVGTEGIVTNPLRIEDTVEMPQGSELIFLPQRMPMLYNLKNYQLEVLDENPDEPGEAIFPVAAFNSPGYLVSHTCSYKETNKSKFLPLFSYGAVGWSKGSFRSAAILVDNEDRQDLKKMPMLKVAAGIKRMRKLLPKNNLRRHLEKCALTYGCPAGKNFFLGRYEAPIPTSKICNARCLGCISQQSNYAIRSSQDRIIFTPTPNEIAALALVHIEQAKHAIISFGQGCEGDPLLSSDTIVKAIKIIRSTTEKGTINVNTNGSLPTELKRMLDAGLDSVRVSLNSFREKCYNEYFRPRNYHFNDVLTGISLAISKKKHIAINYLSCPGFTDSIEEVKSLENFLGVYPINMIQWRNLNFDPSRYIDTMNEVSQNNLPIGMGKLVQRIKGAFPDIKHGYYNPPKEKF